MIIASDKEETGEDPVSLTEIHYIEKLIHTSTFDEGTKRRMEIHLEGVDSIDEIYSMIMILKQHQKKNLDQELDDALRRSI
jgi:hypothetical protein